MKGFLIGLVLGASLLAGAAQAPQAPTPTRQFSFEDCREMVWDRDVKAYGADLQINELVKQIQAQQKELAELKAPKDKKDKKENN